MSTLKRIKPENKYKSSVVFSDKAPEELGPNVEDPVTEKDPNPVDNPTPIAMDIADPNDSPPMVNPSQDNEHDSTRIGARRKTKMFLSKPLINPYRVKHTQKMKDYTRKHKTFGKIKLAKITSELISDQENEVLKCFRSVVDKIWELDATAIVVAWKEEATDKPLRKNSEFPKSKEQLSKYSERLWIERTKNPLL